MVRHVRTPAGVEHYHKPIGTPIVVTIGGQQHTFSSQAEKHAVLQKALGLSGPSPTHDDSAKVTKPGKPKVKVAVAPKDPASPKATAKPKTSVKVSVPKQAAKSPGQESGDTLSGIDGEKSLLKQMRGQRTYQPEQKQAVGSYAARAYNRINSYLRGVKNPDSEPSRLTDADVKERISLINGAMSPLPSSVSVTRGISSTASLPSKNLVGASITNKGFVSTSFSPTHARRFAAKGEHPAVFEVTVPKGSRGLPMPLLTSNKDEHELVLPHNTQFHITGDEMRTVNGKQVRWLTATAQTPT